MNSPAFTRHLANIGVSESLRKAMMFQNGIETAEQAIMALQTI